MAAPHKLDHRQADWLKNHLIAVIKSIGVPFAISILDDDGEELLFHRHWHATGALAQAARAMAKANISSNPHEDFAVGIGILIPDEPDSGWVAIELSSRRPQTWITADTKTPLADHTPQPTSG